MKPCLLKEHSRKSIGQSKESLYTKGCQLVISEKVVGSTLDTCQLDHGGFSQTLVKIGCHLSWTFCKNAMYQVFDNFCENQHLKQ